MFDRPASGTRAVLVQVDFGQGGIEERLVDERQRLAKGAQDFSREELFFALALCQQLVRDIRWARAPKFLIEAALLKIAHRSDLRPISDLIEELKVMQSKLPAQNASSSENVKAQPLSHPPVPTKSVHSEGSAGHSAPKAAQAFAPVRSSAPEKKTAPRASESQTSVMVAEETASETASESETAEQLEKRPPKRSLNISLNDVERVWPELLERIKAIKMSCGTYLSEGEPVEVVDGLIVFGFPGEFKFHKEALEKKDNKELIRQTLGALLNGEVQISLVVTEAESQKTTTKKPEPLSQKEHDIITSALDVFQGSKIIYRDF